jgi:hypothetical protein
MKVHRRREIVGRREDLARERAVARVRQRDLERRQRLPEGRAITNDGSQFEYVGSGNRLQLAADDRQLIRPRRPVDGAIEDSAQIDERQPCLGPAHQQLAAEDHRELCQHQQQQQQRAPAEDDRKAARFGAPCRPDEIWLVAFSGRRLGVVRRRRRELDDLDAFDRRNSSGRACDLWSHQCRHAGICGRGLLVSRLAPAATAPHDRRSFLDRGRHSRAE